MTLLAAPPADRTEVRPRSGRSTRDHLREHGDVLALLVGLVVLLGPVAHAGGGRDRHILLLGLVSLLPALLLGRVWQLGLPRVLTALGPGLGAVVVCLTAPTGWAGAGDVARLLYAGFLWLAVRRIVDRPERRTLVLVAIAIGGLWQFEQAYLSWWGGGDSSHAMSGTFYASNVFAAYMAGAGLCALVLAATGARPFRLVGFIAAPFCLAAVIFSSSRATIALTLGACAVAAAVLAAHRSWSALGRLAAALVASAALATLLASPLLMSDGAGALAGATNKGSTAQTLSSSGGVRLQWWDAAVRVGLEHPVSGAGFGSFGGAESRFQPADAERSIYAHNVALQAWADGGVALALPVGLALLGIVIGFRRQLRSTSTSALAGLLGAGVMTAHALLDVDAQYPACLGLAVVVAAVGVARPPVLSADRPDRARTCTAVLLLLVVAVLAAARFDVADARIRAAEVSGGAWTGAEGPFRDARFDVLRLKQGQHDAALLERTLRLQPDRAEVAWGRARALQAAGQPAAARALADATWRSRATGQPGLALPYADVLVALGDHEAAVRTLVAAFRSAVHRPTSGNQPVIILEALGRLDRPAVALCLVAELPDRLREKVSAPAPGNCSGTLRPFDDGVRS